MKDRDYTDLLAETHSRDFRRYRASIRHRITYRQHTDNRIAERRQTDYRKVPNP